MEEIPEELAQVRVVGLVVKPQGATEVQVGGKLRCGGQRVQQSSDITTMYTSHTGRNPDIKCGASINAMVPSITGTLHPTEKQ